MKAGMVLSLTVNIALVVSLSIVSRNANKMVTDVAAVKIAECKRNVTTAAKTAYRGGCLTAIIETRGLRQGDLLLPMFEDYCMQGAETVGEKFGK